MWNIQKRTVSTIILILLAMVAPWWLALLFVFVLMVGIPRYFEGIAVGALVALIAILPAWKFVTVLACWMVLVEWLRQKTWWSTN